MKYVYELAERGIKVFKRIADSLEKIVEHQAQQPQPIYFVPEGDVVLTDFPQGTNIVRCTLRAFKAVQDGKIENPTYGLVGKYEPETGPGDDQRTDTECENCGLYPSSVVHRAECMQ